MFRRILPVIEFFVALNDARSSDFTDYQPDTLAVEKMVHDSQSFRHGDDREDRGLIETVGRRTDRRLDPDGCIMVMGVINPDCEMRGKRYVRVRNTYPTPKYSKQDMTVPKGCPQWITYPCDELRNPRLICYRCEWQFRDR